MNLSAARRNWARWRDGLRERRFANLVYRVVVGFIGTVVLLVGIVTIPYPGPGWAIVFLGLAILASEFRFAQVALRYARTRYDTVMSWFSRQHIAVKGLSAAFTGVVVVATLWLLGAVGWSADLVGLEHPWLESPIGLGS